MSSEFSLRRSKGPGSYSSRTYWCNCFHKKHIRLDAGGIYYGWPKNGFHAVGIHEAIFDISSSKPYLAIVGMEGDGPIMGHPRHVGMLVFGRNRPAVDGTCSRVMGINLGKIQYLKAGDGRISTIRENNISQRGETIASVRTPFALVDKIPAHQGLRLDKMSIWKADSTSV